MASWVVPKLVEDVSLKRARVDSTDGTSAIIVQGVDTPVTPTDLTPITNALGTRTDTTSDNSIIGLLKQEVAKPATDLTAVTDALGETTDTSSDNTVVGLLKRIDTSVQNISSGGVGEAYPGSTGGEIFNCYEGTGRNVASGNYSTAGGQKNQSLDYGSVTYGYNNVNSGYNTFVMGANNQIEGKTGAVVGDSNRVAIVSSANPENVSCIIGKHNSIQSDSEEGSVIILGTNNTNSNYPPPNVSHGGYSGTSIFIGADLDTKPDDIMVIGKGFSSTRVQSDYWSGYGTIYLGYYLNGCSNCSCILGTYNAAPSENDQCYCLIGAASNKGAPANAIECYDAFTKLLKNVRLSSGGQANAIDTPINTPASSTDKTLATLGSFQKRYKSWYSSIVFTPDTPKTATDLPSGFQAALYQATEAEFTGTYWGVQVRAKFRLSPNSDETILANPVVCYNTDNGTYSHTRGFVLKLEKTSSTVTITMEQGTSIDFGNNDNTFNSYVDSTTTFNVSYIQLKMTNF